MAIATVRALLLASFIMASVAAMAQHQHSSPPASAPAGQAQHDGMAMPQGDNAPDAATGAAMDPQMEMSGAHGAHSGAGTAHLASGTSWQPASTPHAAWMWQPHGWSVMAHGVLFL